MKFTLTGGFAFERLMLKFRCVVFAACLILYAKELGPMLVGLGAGYVGVTQLVRWWVGRNEEVYESRGAWFTWLRSLDVAVLPLASCLIPGHDIQFWLLCIPLVVSQALSGRSKSELLLVGLVAVAAEGTGLKVSHVPVHQWVKPLLLLGCAPGVGFVLQAYQDYEERLLASDRRLASLLSVAGSVSGSQNLSSLILAALQAVVKDLRATAGYVMLVDEEDQGRLHAEAAFGTDGSFEVPQTLEAGAGLSGYVAKMGQPIEIHEDGPQALDCDGLSIEVRSAASVPLISRSFGAAGEAPREEVLGAMTIVRSRGGAMHDVDMNMVMSVSSLIAAAIANTRMQQRQRATFVSTLESLATALEARDEYTQGHSRRVCDVSLLIGQQMNFTNEMMEELRIGTTLHDIGKIGVPDSILNKPARLTDEEFELMKAHPVIGYEICKPLMLSEGVLMLIRNHHEKLDGSGYPDGLKGGELPLSLRIVCVVDAFDAMSSRRPYRDVMDINRVIGEMSRCAGIQFDPVVVESLKELLHAGHLDPIYATQWDHLTSKAA